MNWHVLRNARDNARGRDNQLVTAASSRFAAGHYDYGVLKLKLYCALGLPSLSLTASPGMVTV